MINVHDILHLLTAFGQSRVDQDSKPNSFLDQKKSLHGVKE